MNKTVKYLISAAVAAAVFVAPAMACGGKPCSSANCDFKSENCPTSKNKSSYKKGHRNIPGKSPAYVRKILKKGDQVGLNDSQKKEVGKLLIAAETGAAKAHAEAQIVVADFRSKLHSKGGVSDSDIKAYIKRMGELRSDKLMSNLMASVRASRLLSDEQKSKLYAGKKYQDGKK